MKHVVSAGINRKVLFGADFPVFPVVSHRRIDDETGYALMRQLNEDLESGHRHVLVAEKDGVIAGQLILAPSSSPNHRHIVELIRGAIHPSFRGGELILRAFQEVARKCAVAEV